MGEIHTLRQPSLIAKSPYVLRINLGKHTPESEVRAALASGDMGFLHSFTTGATVDGPGVRVVAWTSGCMWRCVYCHNPDTWSMTNGLPITITRASEELRKYRHGLKILAGGFTLSGGEPLMQHRFAVKLFAAAKATGIHTALDTNGYLKALLERRGLTLVVMQTSSRTTFESAQALDLRTNVPEDPKKKEAEGMEDLAIDPEEHGTVGVMIKRTLRSGRTVHSRGHVVVFGDVNPGAQIIAAGDIIIWGKLRGMVHAGAEGDTDAVICALDMSPNQLRIAGAIATSPSDKNRKIRPEVASVRENRIVVEAWE